MASNWHAVSFTGLELRGLLVRLTGGDTTADPTLDLAAEKGLEKMFRAEGGMNPDWRPGAKTGQRHGPRLDMGWGKKE